MSTTHAVLMDSATLRTVLAMARAAIRFEIARCAVPGDARASEFHDALDAARRCDREFQTSLRLIPGRTVDVLDALVPARVDAFVARSAEVAALLLKTAEERDEAGELVLALANTAASGHAVTHPLHIAEPVESCAVCSLLERARRWAR